MAGAEIGDAMNAQTPLHDRTMDLPDARGFGVSARFFTPMLDRIDRGLETGWIELHLPDDQVRVLGGRSEGPGAIVHLHSWRALLRLRWSGSVGWYRAWAAGEWSSPDLVPLFELFMRNRLTLMKTARSRTPMRQLNQISHWVRRNTRAGARRNIAAHYDLGNDFYAAWLDPGMNYSSAMFPSPDDGLEAAQRTKNEAILTRLDLKPGVKLLDIGCGWGALAVQAAQDHGAHVQGITLSAEQKSVAESRAREIGQQDAISIHLTDYRDVTGQYDAIASVEMVEAVGAAYWPAFLDMIANGLKPGGRAALQFITIADDVYEHYDTSADFIQTYVFPGGMLVSESRFRAMAEKRGLRWENPEHFGMDYAQTLRLWRTRFDAAVASGTLPARFDARFINLWRYYLQYCEGGFRSGGIDVVQVTLCA
jgi:cyclopropane-fatty-acyl-phospholipid synthase